MIKKFIKKFLPNFVLKYKERYNLYKERKKFSNMDLKDVFKEIYLKKMWCPEHEKSNFKFYSGLGSYYPEFVLKYLEETSSFLRSLSKKPDVVDLGCGDFVVGSKLRKHCNQYIAADIFDELIDFNKQKYRDLNVDFRVLDITCDELPKADVCFARQVLQHLSNDSIKNFIKLIKNKYKYLILTEHFPEAKNFPPNLDKPDGPDIRLVDNSAVVLTMPPFNLKVKKELVLCETRSESIIDFKGVIKTQLLHLY
jgi:hypothetical protein|tara:strand:- start:757 stop:1515 length:759 start_codon:yes stop_codon:yes gene_type:complete